MLASSRRHCYIYPFLHHSSTKLLLLTILASQLGGWGACIRTCIPKSGHVFSYMLDVLNWLILQQRISSWIWSGGPFWVYLRDLCHTTFSAPGFLLSTERGKFIVLLPNTQQLSRLTPSQRLVPYSGMGFLWYHAC